LSSDRRHCSSVTAFYLIFITKHWLRMTWWLTTVGTQQLSLSGCSCWSSLPKHATSAPLMGVFWSFIKCHLFSISCPVTWPYSACTQCHFGHFNCSCYLLTYFVLTKIDSLILR